MARLVKIGDRIINLDQVVYVERWVHANELRVTLYTPRPGVSTTRARKLFRSIKP